MPESKESRTGDGRHRTIDAIDPETLFPEELPTQEDINFKLKEALDWMDKNGLENWSAELMGAEVRLGDRLTEDDKRTIIGEIETLKDIRSKIKEVVNK